MSKVRNVRKKQMEPETVEARRKYNHRMSVAGKIKAAIKARQERKRDLKRGVRKARRDGLIVASVPEQVAAQDAMAAGGPFPIAATETARTSVSEVNAANTPKTDPCEGMATHRIA